ncbi:NYN domain-containing protein [Candidatus Zixiibacteriota bacterium]
MALKAGLFVDASNLYRKDRATLNYRALRQVVADSNDLMRCNVYVAVDPENSKPVRGFMAALRGIGFKVIDKEWSRNVNGHLSASLDMELAIDVLTQSSQLDVIFLVTGDPDFTRLVRAIQNKGKRVEVIAYQDRIGYALKQEADEFHSLESIENIFMEEPDEPQPDTKKSPALESQEDIIIEEPDEPQPDTNESPALQKLEERQGRIRGVFRK